MRTQRVSQPCLPSTLHLALEAAGIEVATVRADWAMSGDPLALWAVIVFAEGYSPVKAEVDRVVQAHLTLPEVKGNQPSTLPDPQPDKEACLSMLERI